MPKIKYINSFSFLHCIISHGENMLKNYFAGIDIGTSYTKVVIINQNNKLIGTYVGRTGSNLKDSLTTAFNTAISKANIADDDIKHITATGFGRNNVSFANTTITEIKAHAKGAYFYYPKKINIIDIGGQDTKIIKIDKNGKTIGFKMNRKCAAGTGSFLEEISYKLNIPLDKMNILAAKSVKETALSSFCTVFASTEILTRIKEGEKTEDMIKSAFESVVRRVIEMDTLKGSIVITGGVVEYNDIILKILGKYVGNEISTTPYPQLNGAIGAALIAKDAKD